MDTLEVSEPKMAIEANKGKKLKVNKRVNMGDAASGTLEIFNSEDLLEVIDKAEEIVKKTKKTSRVNGGESTNELIHSAYLANNDDVFPEILKIYVKKQSVIAEVTYGKGVFWKKVKLEDYQIRFSDLKTKDLPDYVQGGVDSRKLPYEENTFDAVVFDPPYMHTPGGTAHNGHQNFENYYQNNAEQDAQIQQEINRDYNGTPPKYHDLVLDLYYRSAREAFRVLKNKGIYIVKCQDEVCANKQRLTHIEITVELAKYGFICEDMFIVVRKNKPGVSRIKNQYHARKNHSYFMVYRKVVPKAKAVKA